MDVRELVKEYGEPYSRMLGIDLRKGDPAYVKWLLASILYAKPIREEAATKTYKIFQAHGLTDARSIVDAGWDRLVALLDEGGYTRYDFSTADRLLETFGNLLREYDGSLRRLYDSSPDSEALERRLMGLGKGVGPVTVSIFLRDMQAVWPGARPKSTPRMIKAARALGIKDIRAFAEKHGLSPGELETALHCYSRVLKKAGRI
ncbi:MAG TPA: hypothetical protein VMC61_06375 [Methanocella sp.]|nr:hypothetical protein [Methanocella sp.]